MAIVIKTIKVVTPKGHKGRFIERVIALKENELPDAYLSGSPWVAMRVFDHWSKFMNGLVINDGKDMHILQEGHFVREDEFHKMLAIIREAGNRLHEINAEIEKERARFGHGAKETFII